MQVRRSLQSVWRTWPTYRRECCRPGRSGGLRSRGSCCLARRYGCSTNRHWDWTPHRSSGSAACSGSIVHAAGWRSLQRIWRCLCRTLRNCGWDEAARECPTMTYFAAVLARELRLSVRHGADTLAALLFFLLAASLFPLAIGPAPEALGHLAPGIVWVCSLLAALLPLDRLFGADFEDGSLD